MKIKCKFIEFHAQSGVANEEIELHFSQNDLFKAALTVGKESWNQIYQFQYYSEREIQFRIEMIRAFLSFDEEFIKKSEAFYALDPLEKGANNYFFGMIFSNLIALKKLDVKWLVHLDFTIKVKLLERKIIIRSPISLELRTTIKELFWRQKAGQVEERKGLIMLKNNYVQF